MNSSPKTSRRPRVTIEVRMIGRTRPAARLVFRGLSRKRGAAGRLRIRANALVATLTALRRAAGLRVANAIEARRSEPVRVHTRTQPASRSAAVASRTAARTPKTADQV
nr:hypothetical protein [Nocardiopsis sp. Huas11]